MKNNELPKIYHGNIIAAMPCTDAIRLLSIGARCCDDCLCYYGISVLRKGKSFISDNIWWTLSIVPTIHQGGFRTSDVECGGCYCCNRSRCAMLHRREG